VDVEIVSRIATKVGLGVKPALMEWGSIIEAVKSGRVDVMIGNVRWSAARTQVMYLTDAVYYVAYGLITKQDRVMPANAKIANLKGANIGTMVGATATTEMKKVPGIGDVRFFDRTDSVVRDVLAGRLDYAVLDPMTIAHMSKQDPSIKLKKILLEYDAEFPLLTGKTESVLGMSKDNPDLYDMMNAGIRWLWRTKQIGEILAKYGLSEDFVVAPPSARVGTDRDAAGAVINMSNHAPKDYSALFA
jgi:polar amino acid transport system substrate-binding protein